MNSIKFLLATLLFTCLVSNTSSLRAFEGYETDLAAEFGQLSNQPSAVTATYRLVCTQCHNTSDVFRGIVRSNINAGQTVRNAIRNAGNSGNVSFVPFVTGTTNFRVKSSRTTPIDLAYSRGKNNVTNAASSISRYLFIGNPPITFNPNGDLLLGSVTQGVTYTFQVQPENAAGFEPTLPSKLPTITVKINTPPVAGTQTTAPTPTDNGGSSYNSPVLTASPYTSDADGDPLSVTSATILSVVDGAGAIVARPPLLAATFSGSRIGFNPAEFKNAHAIAGGDSRHVTLQYTVSDGLETATNTLQVTVNRASSFNQPIAATSLSRMISEDESALPIVIDLLKDNSGTSFAAPNGLPLSVSASSQTPSGQLPMVSGNSLMVSDLSGFQYLAASESEVIVVDYSISDTLVSTTNKLTVTITGQNDPVTASGFSDTADESFILNTVDLIGGSGASDPDTNDVITATNLRNLSSSVQLKDPSFAQITPDGRSFEFAPEFARDLSLGEVVNVTFMVDITDGKGSSVPIAVTIAVTGVDSSGAHGSSAGLYANSLAARYPLAGFQPASSQPAACFTCHTPAARLNAPKSDCNSPLNFTQFGRELCLDNRGGPFAPRLANREPAYAPSVTESNIIRYLSETAPINTNLPTPISFDAGQSVDGGTSTLHSFDIQNDFGGAFAIDNSGQIKLLRKLAVGTYVLRVTPMNISGSKDANGNIRNVPGFYPLDPASVQPRPLRSSITINITPAPPVANDDRLSAESGQTTTADVLANDTGQITSISVSSAATNGSTSVAPGGQSILYTPNVGYTGTDSFTYTASNGNPANDSTATVSVTVVSAGGALAKDDIVLTTVDTTTTIDVLANDGNVVRNGAGATTVTLTTAPDPATEGTAQVVGQNIEFVPAAGFVGSALLTYTANNPTVSGASASPANVSIMVQAVRAGAIGISASTPELSALATAFGDNCSEAASNGNASPERTAFLAICANITSAINNGEDLDAAFKALRNEEHFAAVDATATIARALGRILSDRIERVKHGGTRGIDLSGLSLNIGGEQIPTQSVTDLANYMLGLGSRAQSNWDENSPWSAFLAGEFSFLEKDPTISSSGYEMNANNLAVGLDYRIDPNRIVGVAVGISSTDTDFSGGGSLNATGFQVSGYGAISDFMKPGLSLDGYVSIGRTDYTSDRRIAFTANGSSVDTAANASFTGTYFNIAPKISFDRTLGDYGDPIKDLGTDMRITWFGSLDYLATRIDGYTETNASGLGLVVDAHTYHSLLLTLGLDASRPLYVGTDFKFELFGNLSGNFELLDKSRSVRSSYAVAGANAPKFTVTEDGNHGFYGSGEIGALFDIGEGNGTISYGMDFNRPDGVRARRISFGYNTPLFGSDTLGISANRHAQSGNRNWSTDLNYQLEF